MTTKSGRVVAYNEELPSIKSQDHLFMGFCTVTWQIKYISLLPQGLWPLNLVITITGFHAKSYTTLWTLGHTRILDKLNTLYLFYYKDSGHWMGQGGDLLWEASTNKITQLFKHVVFWDHVTKQKRFICTTTMPEATKFSGVVTFVEGLPSIKLHDHLSKWLCEVTLKIKNVKSHLSQCLFLPNLSG